jgi:hypothetical protein
MKVKTRPKPKAKSKPIAKPSFNYQHEDVRHKIEKAFKAGNVQYYKFIDEHQIPAGRYKYIFAALREADLRLDRETLGKFIETMKNLLNGGKKNNMINLGELWKLILNIESRWVLGFEPASVERLAAVIYFDAGEDLSTYSSRHGAEKIQHWKRHNVNDFFLTKPIAELFGTSGISTTSLEDYIQDTTEMIKILTTDLETASSESSSESGKNPS